jgi:RNA polymerase sigma-70 factor (ECF subfamily)
VAPTNGSNRRDADLVRGAIRGDGAACEELVRRYLRRAFGVALAIVQNVADAEDVAQEALAAAFERLHECRIPECFGAWLLRGVRNRALNQRAQVSHRAALLDGLPRDATGDGPAHALPLGEALLSALDQLPPIRRTVMLLHDIEEWTHAEIAAALRISVVMSRQHLFQARKALRDLLGEGGALLAPG